MRWLPRASFGLTWRLVGYVQIDKESDIGPCMGRQIRILSLAARLVTGDPQTQPAEGGYDQTRRCRAGGKL